MNRRQFLRYSSVVSALLAMGRLPALARTGDVHPVAVEPVTGFLPGFDPPGRQRLPATYRLTYDIVVWHQRDPETGVTDNSVAGQTRVERLDGIDVVRLVMDEERRYSAVANRLVARATCARDDLGTLKAWELRTSWRSAPGAPPPRYRLDSVFESGRKEGGRVVYSDGRREPSARPLASLWSLADFVSRRGRPTTDLSLDFLADLSSVSPSARLRYDGPIDVAVAGRQQVSLASYLLTGPGLLPTHYLIDDLGLPELVTVSMVSYALREVSG